MFFAAERNFRGTERPGVERTIYRVCMINRLACRFARLKLRAVIIRILFPALAGEGLPAGWPFSCSHARPRLYGGTYTAAIPTWPS